MSAFHGRERLAFFQSPEAVSLFSEVYHSAKEATFFRHLLRLLPAQAINADATFLELGGGPGIHGEIIGAAWPGRYVHSDYSTAMCAEARQKGLESIVLDALAPGLWPRFDVLFACALSSLVYDEPTRLSQLEAFAKGSRRGNLLLLSTPPSGNGIQGLGRNEANMLEQLGFRTLHLGRWGVTPKALWATPFSTALPALEAVFTSLGLGVRSIGVFQRI